MWQQLASITLALIFVCTDSTQALDSKKGLTLESIFESDEFTDKTLKNVQWSKDRDSFTYNRENPTSGLVDIYEHSASKGTDELLLAGGTLEFGGKAISLSHHKWSLTRQYLMVSDHHSRTWDSVREAAYYIYEAASGTFWALADGSKNLRNVRLSPDGTQVGYVLDNNLYIIRLKDKSTHAVTVDGDENIFNGIFDYGSTEFQTSQAWLWSPDSRKIAFWKIDATQVKAFYLLDELGKYNTLHTLKYPNTGEQHAIIQVGVFDTSTLQTSWMNTGDDVDSYIPAINWAGSSQKLLVQRLTRDHDTLDLLLADITSGQSQSIVTDTDPAWVDITTDLLVFRNKDKFVWTSEKSGYRHAYLYDHLGNEKQLTSGNWEITSLIALDDISGWLYFNSKKDSFIEQHIYRVRTDGTDMQKLSGAAGWYGWNVSPDGQYAIEQYSNAHTPPRTLLKSTNGKTIRVLEKNKLAALDTYNLTHPEFIKVKTSDGFTLNAAILKPSNFDPRKKYPVITYGYGNAGSQVVMNKWAFRSSGPARDLFHKYMTELGYIVFLIDNRTTAGRGKLAKNMTYGHYGKYAVIDQIEGAKYLKSLPYVDPERVGFWGWSGGGYLAAALMTKGAPHFKTAISVAPVIDLSRYQSVGVERWMGQLEENPLGYADVNLINHADKLQGNLLLIHGTGDENVKYAFTLQFADALIKKGKQFDMMLYPNQHHGIEDHKLHVFTKIRNYFLSNL